MSSSINTPELKTVIAIDVVASTLEVRIYEQELERKLTEVALYSSALQVVKKLNGHKLFLIFPHAGIPILPLMKSLYSVVENAQRVHASPHYRLLAHHGLVFVQTEHGHKVHLGSGARTVQILLQRSPEKNYCAMTPAFIAIIGAWMENDIILSPLPDTCANDRLQQFTFADTAASATAMRNIAMSQAQLDAMTRRLATYLGPFAPALVEGASLQARSTGDLIQLLGKQISNPKERRRFEDDVERLLMS